LEEEKFAFLKYNNVNLILQVSDKRSALKQERGRQEPQGDSIPDPGRKDDESARVEHISDKLQTGYSTKQTARDVKGEKREEREGETLIK